MNKLILTIDDNEDFNKIVSAILKKNNFEVITTTSPNIFFEKLKNTNPALCLIDLNFDKSAGEGFQLIKAIRNKRGFDIPLLVLSRRSSQSDISLALQVGATDYIQKPIDEVTLISKINYALKLYQEDLSRFNFKKISTTLGTCHIKSHFKIYSLDEFGITITSKSLISKGTKIEIAGAALDRITQQNMMKMNVYVSKNWYEGGLYYHYLDFDPSNVELLHKIRRFILDQQKIV